MLTGKLYVSKKKFVKNYINLTSVRFILSSDFLQARTCPCMDMLFTGFLQDKLAAQVN